MKVLITTRGSSGHLLPLAPIGHACVAAGHEVRVAAQGQHAQNVERTGLSFVPVGDPPAEEWMPRPALERVLTDPDFKRNAARVAASIVALPPVDEAPAALAELQA
jgi:UDP:flavonoid glycosyltransferase YjiC (YdhE family)